MPMELLQSLATQPLPVEIADDEIVDKLMVLQEAHLIAASIPPPEQLPSGFRNYKPATVIAVTPEGLRAAHLAPGGSE
ncbi:hypothetical protein BH10PSE18_BH10PSE18_17590 [soil metagenome]